MKPLFWNFHLRHMCRQQDLFERDVRIFGTGFLLQVERRKWNPMRYIFGVNKLRRLHPMHVLVKTYSSN